MDYSCEEVQEQLDQLKAISFRLGDAMSRTADDLRAHGSSPAPELIADLQHYRHRFQALQAWLATQPGGTAHSQPLTSLDDLQHDLETRQVARRAVEFLDALQHLAHADSDQHPALLICQRARQATLDALQGSESVSRPAYRAIVDGVHPLNALWNLIQYQGQLTDEEWSDALDRVAQHLGREVATSVARNKLYIPAAMVPVAGTPALAH